MLRITHIATALFVLGSIHTASAQEQWRVGVSAADNAVIDGDHAIAIQLLESALPIAQDQQDISGIAEINARFATVHVAQADYPAAESRFNKAIAAMSGSATAEQVDLPVLLVERARLRIMTGDSSGAVADLERAIEIREQQVGPQHITVADTLDELAELHLGQSDFRPAMALFSRAAKIRERTLGESHPMVALGHDNLARVHLARGDTAAAANNLRQALRIRREAWNNRHPAIADNLERLAEVSLTQQDIETAIGLVEEALAIRVDLFGSENEAVANTERHLASLRQKLDQGLQPTLGTAVSTEETPIPLPAVVDEGPLAIVSDQPTAPVSNRPASTKHQAAIQPIAQAVNQQQSQVAATPPGPGAGSNPPPRSDTAAYLVQLSSLRSGDIARQEWQRLSAAYPQILGTRDLLLTTVELPDRGTFYRVRTGPFASPDAARQVCADLAQHQQACLVIAP